MGSANPSGSGDTGSSAGAAQGGMAQGSEEHPAGESVQGKVSKISSKAVSITPKGGTAKTLKIGDETTVTIDGKAAKPSQLKQGQMVHASYANHDGEDVAMKIEAKSAKKKNHANHTGGAAGSTGSGSGSSGSSSTDSDSH